MRAVIVGLLLLAFGALSASAMDLPDEHAVIVIRPLPIPPEPPVVAPIQLPPPINPDDRQTHAQYCRDACVDWEWNCRRVSGGHQCHRGLCRKTMCLP